MRGRLAFELGPENRALMPRRPSTRARASSRPCPRRQPVIASARPSHPVKLLAGTSLCRALLKRLTRWGDDSRIILGDFSEVR